MPATDRAAALEALQRIDQRVRPVTMADHQLLPVVDPLASLLPGSGLRRGTTVEVGGPAATSLALSLVSEASGQGSWVAVVGLPSLGLVAASELGVALDRLALVPHVAPGTWATVVAALIDAVDIVMVGSAFIRPTDARRVASRLRERGAVVIPVGVRWPEAADVRLVTSAPRWEGLGVGNGHLTARRVTINAEGRRQASRRRFTDVWMPAATGGVAAVAPIAAAPAPGEAPAPSSSRSLRAVP